MPRREFLCVDDMAEAMRARAGARRAPPTRREHGSPMLSHINVARGEDTIDDRRAREGRREGGRATRAASSSDTHRSPTASPRKLMDVSRLKALGMEAARGPRGRITRALAYRRFLSPAAGAEPAVAGAAESHRRRPVLQPGVPSRKQCAEVDLSTSSSTWKCSSPTRGLRLTARSDVIRKWESRLAGWRSHPDHGQSAAINESIAKAQRPTSAGSNSDHDRLPAPGALARLMEPLLERDLKLAMSYGRAWHFQDGIAPHAASSSHARLQRIVDGAAQHQSPVPATLAAVARRGTSRGGVDADARHGDGLRPSGGSSSS